MDYKFQSTHLREVRRAMILFRFWTKKYFNPRTYVRCDCSQPAKKAKNYKFQSTHLREVRLFIKSPPALLGVFQSTHLREVRPVNTLMASLGDLFQSTHLREVRLDIVLK